jgi:hypothetical protein
MLPIPRWRITKITVNGSEFAATTSLYEMSGHVCRREYAAHNHTVLLEEFKITV